MTKQSHAALLICLVVLGSLLYLGSLAIGPRLTQENIDQGRLWLQNIYFSEYFGVSLNLDSYYYLIGAKDTRTVLARDAIVQSRPLLSFIVHPISQLLEKFPMEPFPGAPPLFNQHFPTYVGFVVLNLLMLITCYWLYVRLIFRDPIRNIGSGHYIAAAPSGFLIGTLLIANEITKAYFFAAHTQMFNLLVPIVALAAFLYLRAPNINRRTYIVHGFFIGLAALAYGAVMVAGAMIMFARVARHVRTRDVSSSQVAIDLTLIAATLVIPYAGWWGAVTLITGGFYSHEIVRWHQVVWMFQVVDKGWWWLISTLVRNVFYFIESALHHLRTALPIAFVLLLYSWPHRYELKNKLKTDNTFFVGAIVAGLFFLVFFSVVGYRVDRLAMPVAVMGIVMLGAWCVHLETILDAVRRRQLEYVVGGMLLLQAAWISAKDGPFS